MERKTKYWFDTEFIEDGKTIELISIGIVCEDGRELYCENSSVDLNRANDWVKENVIPHLWHRQEDKKEYNIWLRGGGRGGFMSHDLIRYEVRNFVHLDTDAKPEFWAYYDEYDWVVLCQLFGTMMDLPEGWPMFAMDLKQSAVMIGDPELPKQSSTEHHALEDARWTKEACEFLYIFMHSFVFGKGE